jgi:tetratricopeptide (TPR) repeat protein
MNRADSVRFEAAIDSALAAGDLDRAEALARDYRRAAEGDSDVREPDRKPEFRAAYMAARVALDAGQLGQAVERLAPLLQVADRLPTALAGRVCLLAAEALARQRRGAAARSLLDRVPDAVRASDPLVRLRALRVRLWLDEVGDLGDELTGCRRSLEERGDTTNLALLACEEGRAWEKAGDLGRAEECWRRAESCSAGLADGPIRADVLLQLGRLDHLRGRLAAALQRYDAVLSCVKPGPQRLETQLRRQLVRFDLVAWDAARAEASHLLAALHRGALPEEVRPLAGMVEALLEGVAPPDAAPELRGYLAALRGDTGAARSYYADALARGSSPERRARAVLALGLLALHQRAPAEARLWLRQAEELGRSYDLPEVLIRALQVSGQIAAELEGNDDLARGLFEDVVLLGEVVAGRLTNHIERAAYRGQLGSVLQNLLRSACRRGDAAAVFRYQELERGRLLLDLLASTGPARVPLFRSEAFQKFQRELQQVEDELRTAAGPAHDRLLRQHAVLLLQRDRCFEAYLGERGRDRDAVLPAIPDIAELQQILPPDTLYVAPVLTEDELFLLVVVREGKAAVVPGGPSAAVLRRDLEAWRESVQAQFQRYRHGWLNRTDRADLDALLEGLGHGPLGEALASLRPESPTPCRRLLWVPHGPLHALPIQALRRDKRYLIEDQEVVWHFGGALLVRQARYCRRRSRFRPALVVTESAAVLPEAEREGDGVAGAFWRGRRLRGKEASRSTVHAALGRAVAAHFACHAEFDPDRPLAACVRLPSGEALHALEWLDEPVAGLRLVTLSACRSAEVAPVFGRDMFGLVTGLLGGGVGAVLAGLWPVADRETLPLMWRFYNRRLTEDLATALAQAQRGALADPDGSPLFWSAFALFGDGRALPPVCPWLGWLARWRQRRHARRFPVEPAGAR